MMNNQLHERTYNKITVAEAIRKTRNWRHFIKKVLNVKHGKDLAKGVFISKADIDDLSKLCLQNKDLEGVRAYFTLDQNHEEFPYTNVVKFILVPVLASDAHTHGKDMPFANEQAADENSLSSSNVYDFTRPCPDCCDQTSVLF